MPSSHWRLKIPTWTILERDLKKYPHFDKPISPIEATALVNDPSRVSKHAFLPLIQFEQKWNKWAPKGMKGAPKSRPIRYAARRDSYIFSKYRQELSIGYEAALADANLSNSITAYRKLSDKSGRGKCNIDFALQVFNNIRQFEKCAVIALDVSSFFESLDHNNLKEHWKALLGVSHLPSDHFQVFKAVTKYSYIDKLELYKALKIVGEIEDPKNKKRKRIGFLVKREDMPKGQLCTPKAFRELLKSNSTREILQINKKEYGVPQGTPISDLLANAYLINFDVAMKSYADALNGFYYRYSDDIVLILPGGAVEGNQAMEFAEQQMMETGSQMKIKRQKTFIYEFVKKSANNHDFKKVLGPTVDGFKVVNGITKPKVIEAGANGFEYLGFRFDGNRIFLRDSTVSNLLRKIAKSSNQFAAEAVKKYSDKTLEEVLEYIDIEAFIQRFGRVKNFEMVAGEPSKWTFWTYITKCKSILGKDSIGIEKQIKSHRELMKRTLSSSVKHYFHKLR